MKQRFGVSSSVSVPALGLVGAALLTLTGCVGVQLESGDSATTVPSAPTTMVPTTTGPDDAITDDSEPAATTGPSATTVPTTQTPTTVASPMDCDEFTKATAYRRMLAVADDTAPTDAACADAVTAATAANATFQKGIELNTEFGLGQWDQNADTLYSGLGCADGVLTSDVTNPFDSAIIVWGVAYFAAPSDTSTPTVEAEPFISGVIAPGDTAAVDLAPASPLTASTECGFDTRVLVAPVGDLVADAGLVSVDAANPQVADDPTVWLPALRQNEQRFAADPQPDVAVAEVEDVHSPDLVTVLEDFAGTDESGPDPDGVSHTPTGVLTATVPEITTEVCAVSDVTAGRDEGGQLVMATFTSSSADGDGLVLGLFRRGSDARWRYVGRAVTFPEVLVGGTDCASAPAL